MTAKAESYFKQAEELEALARTARSRSSKALYEHLAWSYRQLAQNADRDPAASLEQDGLPARLIAGDKKAL